MMIRSATNPRKAEVLRKIKAGKLTIPRAAKLAEVPISGIVGWMRLAKIPIPPEFDQPRRRPKVGASPCSEARA